MSVITVFLLVLLGIVVLLLVSWEIERQRKKLFLKRFEGRPKLAYMQQICSAVPNESTEDASNGWRILSRIMKIDPDLLRCDDRLDGILAPDYGFPIEGDFNDLYDELNKSLRQVSSTDAVETVIEAALILGRSRGKNKGAQIDSGN